MLAAIAKASIWHHSSWKLEKERFAWRDVLLWLFIYETTCMVIQFSSHDCLYIIMKKKNVTGPTTKIIHPTFTSTISSHLKAHRNFVCVSSCAFFASLLPLYVFWQRRPDFDNFTLVAWDAKRVWRLICKNVGLWPWSSIAKNADKKPFHNRNLLLKPLTKPSEVLCAEFQVCFAPLST